jgi:hypothetical protein
LSAEEYEIEFVKAYDEYLNLKESIYWVLPWSHDLDYVKLSSAEQQELLNQLSEARDRARELHYWRNDYNISAWFTIEDAKGSTGTYNGWKQLSNAKAALHQIDVPEEEWNQKWVSSDWKQEAIFHYESLELILDETNMWTYNLYDPDDWS